MQRINVDYDGVDLSEVMAEIGAELGHEIRVDPDVEEVVRVSLRDIPWREAVEVIARMTRCKVEERSGGALLLTYPGTVVLIFNEADVRTVLQLLAAYQGKNIVLPEELRGEVTVDLYGIGAERVFQVVLDEVGEYSVVSETEDLLRVVSTRRD